MRCYSHFNNILIASAVVALTACTVGPNYVRPAATVAMPTAFKESQGWKIAKPQDVRLGQGWWKLFNDPQLSALVEQVVISNQNVIAAEAQFSQAKTLVQAARAGYFPTVTAGPTVSRFKNSSNIGAGNLPAATEYSFPADLSWEADVWGRIRRTVEAARESAQASEGDLAAAKLSAQGALAQDYFLLRSQDAQKRLLDQTVKSYQKALELTQHLYASGVDARADVLLAETQLKTTQAQAIDLGVQRAQLEHAIALLVGKPASSFSIASAPSINVFPGIPTALPSQLLERRPDISAAERRMAAANAQIGIAMAAYYPNVSFSASAGMEALSMANWFSWPSRFWALGAGVSGTLFDGGLRNAQTDQARAVYDQTVATYRQTVLTGFQQVEDSLAALRILEAEAKAQDDAVKSSRESLAVTINQYRGGVVSYLNVIAAQSIALANEKSAVAILVQRQSASVLLILALGGGWDASSLETESSKAKN